MIRRLYLLVLVSVLLPVGLAWAQESYPIMEKVAQKIIEHYQTSSCQQLAQQKSQPRTGPRAQIEQRAIQLLRNDPQMRTAFLNRVPAPNAEGTAAPINQLAKMPHYVDPTFKNVVRISLNSLWTTSFVDLAKEPIVLSVPDTKERYYVFSMM